MKTIQDLNILVSSLQLKDGRRNDPIFKTHRTLTIFDNYVRLVDSRKDQIHNSYLHEFIRKVINNRSEEIVKEALELEQAEYDALLKAVKEASMEFATGMTLKIEEEKK